MLRVGTFLHRAAIPIVFASDRQTVFYTVSKENQPTPLEEMMHPLLDS